MATPVLATKLYIPPPRPKAVLRPRLIERLNTGLHHKLTLISAPAGSGKTTLVGLWLLTCKRPIAWLSLDAGENDPVRFLTYLVAALQSVAATVGAAVLSALESPQPPSTDALLTTLLNDMASISTSFLLVLDDYHVIDTQTVDHMLAYLIDHLPPQIHLVIATREDPQIPLARLRAGDQLTELRASDLRFTLSEAAGFLSQVMDLHLSDADIATLERRTEGWIVGLQLAAISLQRQPDIAASIASFAGSHHFVLDYLVEEVLGRLPTSVQTFLLHTSILDRFCASLCEAVMLDPTISAQTTLAYLERANLFMIPLDDERRWYRYHHLFADLLRQRLQQSVAATAEEATRQVRALHARASSWYEVQGLTIEAFQHAVAAQDVERADHLLEGNGMPRHFRGVLTVLLDWLESLQIDVLNARPALWVRHASILVVSGQTTGVEEKLQAAEAALQGVALDEKTRDLIGRIAAIRATLALTRYQIDAMLTQSRRALEYLPPDNLMSRVTANWTAGFAYTLQGNRVAARRAYTEAITLSRAFGDTFTTILAVSGLGAIQEMDNQLSQAAETYQHVLHLAGEQPLQIVCEAQLGLARILYEWNDLDGAWQHGQQGWKLARQYDERVIDRYIACEVFLARLKLAQGDVEGAATLLAQTNQTARQHNFVHRFPEVAAMQVLILLKQGQLTAAAHIAQSSPQPFIQARVQLAQGDAAAALALLSPLRQQAEAKGWQDERLKVMLLQALALQQHGERQQALQLLGEALALAEPAGFVRLFVDEGLPMARLLAVVAAQGIMPNYIRKLLTVWQAEAQQQNDDSSALPAPAQALIEPLSQRELEVLHLIVQGLSNQQISTRLFLALSTVKGHNRKIFDKLGVQRRTEAVARARELGLV